MHPKTSPYRCTPNQASRKRSGPKKSEPYIGATCWYRASLSAFSGQHTSVYVKVAYDPVMSGTEHSQARGDRSFHYSLLIG